MRRVHLGVIALLVAAPLISSPAFAAPGKPPPTPTDPVAITDVKVKGSGCHKSATVAMSPDNTAFTVTYNSYMVQAGPDAGNDDEKNCQLTLKVDVPKGHRYAINGVIHRGFAHLEKRATAKYVAKYQFKGNDPKLHTSESTFAGVYDDNWQVTDSETSGFEQCGKKRQFVIDTTLTVDGSKSAKTDSSYVMLDSSDGSLRTTYKLVWETCKS
jgi:hypothetical protein